MIDESIFPKNCYFAFMDDGGLSSTAKAFSSEQVVNDLRGVGVENPCYGCNVDPCGVRTVRYHSGAGRYIAPPRRDGERIKR